MGERESEIESNEPGLRIEWDSFTIQGPSTGPPSWMSDPDELAWRMRISGYEEEQIAAAGRKLHEGPQALSAWLDAQQEPDPPRCMVCGHPLVAIDWRGEATVACDRCGATWHVTVDAPDRHSIAGIGDDPSAEWLQDHPDGGVLTVEAATVIEAGVPPIPVDPPPDVYFPVAAWQARDRAVVLFLRKLPADLVNVEGGRWEEYTVFLARTGDRWEETYADPSVSWLDPIHPADGFFERFGAWFGELHCDSDASDPEALWALGGRAGPQIERIEIITDLRVETVRPNRPGGFFVAALTGTGTFQFVDAHGEVVRNIHGQPLELDTEE